MTQYDIMKICLSISKGDNKLVDEVEELVRDIINNNRQDLVDVVLKSLREYPKVDKLDIFDDFRVDDIIQMTREIVPTHISYDWGDSDFVSYAIANFSDYEELTIEDYRKLIQWANYRDYEIVAKGISLLEFYANTISKVTSTDNDIATQNQDEITGIPIELLPVLEKGMEAGLLDEKYQPFKGVMTKVQMKLFAMLSGVMLNLKTPWKTFEDLWNVKGLQRTKEEQGNMEKAGKIAALFPDGVVKKCTEKYKIVFPKSTE